LGRWRPPLLAGQSLLHGGRLFLSKEKHGET
jgi:hypothetical protein